MPRNRTLVAACLVAALGAMPAWATMYKWTDAQGRTVYSDQPPPTNVKSEQVRPPPPPANPNAAKELAQREADYRKRQTDSAEAASKAETERVDNAQRTENCALAKAQLRQLSENQVAMYRYNDKGQREVMDDDARGRERARVTAFIRDNKCPT